jgi:hypothetical protein
MHFCFAQNLVEALYFGGEDTAADVAEAIVAAACIARVAIFSRSGGGDGIGSCGFFDEAVVHEFFEIVVKRAGAEFIAALRLASNFLHDAVAVEIFGGEGEQDVKLGGGEGKESVEIVFHGRKPIYRNPSMDVKTQFGWYLKEADSRSLKVEGGEEES